MPLTSHVLRMACRNIVILCHNSLIILIVNIFFFITPTWEIFFLVPGFVIFFVNIVWMSIFISIICARFPDLGQIISNILQLAFFVTPIIWTPEIIIERGRTIILDINPFYHLLSVIRDPILGNLPNENSWVVLIVIAMVGWVITLNLLGRSNKKIVYWI